jgi:hypothetical protein
MVKRRRMWFLHVLRFLRISTIIAGGEMEMSGDSGW